MAGSEPLKLDLDFVQGIPKETLDAFAFHHNPNSKGILIHDQPKSVVTCCGCMRSIQVARVACRDCSGRTANIDRETIFTVAVIALPVVAFLVGFLIR